MQEEEGELFFWTGAMVAEKKEERGVGRKQLRGVERNAKRKFQNIEGVG